MNKIEALENLIKDAEQLPDRDRDSLDLLIRKTRLVLSCINRRYMVYYRYDESK